MRPGPKPWGPRGRMSMSNARTFLWLFAYVQIGFITVDLCEHWRLARRTGVRHVLGRHRVLILAVAGACVLYFVIQIALASVLPTIGKLGDYVIRASHASMNQVDARWTIPVFV